MKEPLTKSEIRILELVCQGLNNSEICNKLFVSDNTIRTHLKNIYRKTEIVGLSQRKRANLISHVKEKNLDFLRLNRMRGSK